MSVYGEYDPEEAGPTSVLLYGAAGSGKTRGASTWPKPILLDLEGGMGSIPTKIGRFPVERERIVESMAEVYSFLDVVEKDIAEGRFPYETIIVDSLQEMQTLLQNNAITMYKTSRFYENLPTQSDHYKAFLDLFELIRRFNRLGVHMVYTCKEGEWRENTSKIGPKFIGKDTASTVVYLVDEVGRCKAVSGGRQYVIDFTQNDEHIAKSRSPKPVLNAILNDYKYMPARFVERKEKK